MSTYLLPCHCIPILTQVPICAWRGGDLRKDFIIHLPPPPPPLWYSAVTLPAISDLSDRRTSLCVLPITLLRYLRWRGSQRKRFLWTHLSTYAIIIYHFFLGWSSLTNQQWHNYNYLVSLSPLGWIFLFLFHIPILHLNKYFLNWVGVKTIVLV